PVEHNTAWERIHEASRGQVEDASIARFLRSYLKGREEEFDEESMSDMIDAELVFVTVLGQSGFGGHDTGIADEDVESGRLGEEGLGSVLNGGERQLIALDEGELY
ncbi:MAG: hypothetical protein Q9187_009088, partial [Circinaria calcarea]